MRLKSWKGDWSGKNAEQRRRWNLEEANRVSSPEAGWRLDATFCHGDKKSGSFHGAAYHCATSSDLWCFLSSKQKKICIGFRKEIYILQLYNYVCMNLDSDHMFVILSLFMSIDDQLYGHSALKKANFVQSRQNIGFLNLVMKHHLVLKFVGAACCLLCTEQSPGLLWQKDILNLITVRQHLKSSRTSWQWNAGHQRTWLSYKPLWLWRKML